MSYQNPDYETKLAEVKARKIIGGLKRKNAGRERKEKEAVKGIVSKRKSEIDQKVLEIDAKKLEEAEKKLRTKAKVHPKPEPPKSLVIENTQEAVKAPPPFKPTANRRGRGRGGLSAPSRNYTPEEIAEVQRKIKDYDKKLFGYVGSSALPEKSVPMALRVKSPFGEGQAFAKYKARIASGLSGFSDSEED